MKKPSVLPVGVRLRGEIEGEGDLIVFGQVDGPVRVDGALVIEAGGLVRGHVHARQVTVRGGLKGDAFADEGIRVDDSARIVGDLTAPRVLVTPGAQFAGQVNVQMLEAAPPLRTYDPALHTFTGMLSPEPIEKTAQAVLSSTNPPPIALTPVPIAESPASESPASESPTASGDPASLASGEAPVRGDSRRRRRRERPSRRRAAAKAAGAVEPSVVAEAAESAQAEADDDRPTDHRALAPKPVPHRVGRMPRIGRVKGTHRPRD